jgi:hypothetical protein
MTPNPLLIERLNNWVEKPTILLPADPAWLAEPINSDHLLAELKKRVKSRRAEKELREVKRELASESLSSTLHISPKLEKAGPVIEYYKGASLLKVSRGGKGKTPVGGTRGKVLGFSFASRRRLMQKIAKIERGAVLPDFVTLTYPYKFPSPREAKKHLDTFSKRFRRQFEKGGLLWKLEPQDRGAPHFHLLVWGVELEQLRQFVPQAWFKIAGGGDPLHLAWHRGELGNSRGAEGHENIHCVQPVHTWKGVWNYAAKYLGKTFAVAGWLDGAWIGRYWGVIAPKNIPFGELKQEEIDRQMATRLMRYQRRFAKPVGKKRSKQRGKSCRSLTIFCDADQWVSKVVQVRDKT